MALIQSGGHELMHLFRIVTFDEVGRPAATLQELLQFLMLDAGQDGRVADLEAVEVQDRQHGPVVDGVEKLVGLPCGRQGTGFRLAVADDAGDDQIGIVERRPEGMAERIAQLATFVDRPRRRRGDMAGNPAGERKLLEQLLQPGFVLGNVRINFTPGAFEVNIAHDRRAAMAGTGDVEHVQVILFDDPVQVCVDEVLARRGAPMPDHQGLDVRQLERLLQQRVVVEIDLADRQIVGGPPIGVHLLQQIGRQRFIRRILHNHVPFQMDLFTHKSRTTSTATAIAQCRRGGGPAGDGRRPPPSSQDGRRCVLSRSSDRAAGRVRRRNIPS